MSEHNSKDPDETINVGKEIDRTTLHDSQLPKEELNKHTKMLDQVNFDDQDTKWGTARFNRRMMLELKVRDDEERYVFLYDEARHVTVGRADPKENIEPDVDLGRVNGLERGVSREHARIDMHESGTLMLTDLGSRNGTFLNGQQLSAHQQRVLRDGDDVRFGRVFVRVSFRGRLR